MADVLVVGEKGGERRVDGCLLFLSNISLDPGILIYIYLSISLEHVNNLIIATEHPPFFPLSVTFRTEILRKFPQIFD